MGERRAPRLVAYTDSGPSTWEAGFWDTIVPTGAGTPPPVIGTSAGTSSA
jgi:hypothetical protein